MRVFGLVHLGETYAGKKTRAGHALHGNRTQDGPGIDGLVRKEVHHPVVWMY